MSKRCFLVNQLFQKQIYTSSRSEHFPDPHRFDPERFLKDGRFGASDRVVPFGIGKRACLGQSLAEKQFYIFFAGILQQFELCRDENSRLPAYNADELFPATLLNSVPTFSLKLRRRTWAKPSEGKRKSTKRKKKNFWVNQGFFLVCLYFMRIPFLRSRAILIFPLNFQLQRRGGPAWNWTHSFPIHIQQHKAVWSLYSVPSATSRCCERVMLLKAREVAYKLEKLWLFVLRFQAKDFQLPLPLDVATIPFKSMKK